MTSPTDLRQPIQPLTVFLIKTGTADYEQALDKPAGLVRHDLRRDLPFDGALFLATQRETTPRWLPFLADGVRGELTGLFNASNSGVLFVRASRRIFAITFGYGRALLNPSRIERSFGLRVVLNTVDQEGLKSVDSKTVQELTVHTRRQTSRGSRLTEFGIDKEEDLLGSVAGVPRDPDLATGLSGADALQLRARLGFGDLGAKCRELLQAYRSASYRQRGFEFVDYVRHVADPSLVERLDSELLTGLIEGDWDDIHLAPPEIIDWESIDGFSFVPGGAADPDLQLESFFNQVRRADDTSVERLKRQRVFVHSAQSPEPLPRWSVYRVLVADKRLDGRRYVLSAGTWYEIDRDFADAVTNRVNALQAANLGLPPARQGESEGDYNHRAGRRPGIHSVDGRCLKADGDRIELCDLYSRDRQFVHVKRWKSSSTLSHLFAQGKVSAEAFLMDAGFRREARDLVHAVAPSLSRHIPTRRPDPSRFQVVFAIIKAGTQGWRRSLPFFSQLHLARSASYLRGLGFGVRLERIDMER